MTYRELFDKYDCEVFCKCPALDEEAPPEFEKFMQEFSQQSEEFDRIERERANNST